MIVLYSILLFSESDCLLVLCCIYLHVLIASPTVVLVKFVAMLYVIQFY